MKTISAICTAGLLIAVCCVRAGAQPLPVPPLPDGQGSTGPVLQPSGEEQTSALPQPSDGEPASVHPQASGKEVVSVGPTAASSKVAKALHGVQPVEESQWEIALVGGVREFTLDFNTKPTAAFHTTPLHSSETLTRGYGGLEVRRILRRADSTILRFGLGYNYSTARWDSGEHEAGEAPGEIYELDISRFSMHAHQISAMVDFSWQVSRAWQVGARVGPILSLFDGDFTGFHETFQENASGTDGKFLGGRVVRDSGTEVAVGVMGEVFLRYTLPDSSFFVELRAGYAWTEDVSFGDSAIAANLDGSSWQASLALGYEF